MESSGPRRPTPVDGRPTQWKIRTLLFVPSKVKTFTGGPHHHGEREAGQERCYSPPNEEAGKNERGSGEGSSRQDTTTFESGKCRRSCTCFIRDLLLENLEYVEVTGESWDAIPHLVRPLKRVPALKHTGGDSKQFTLLLNGLNVTSYEELSGKVAKYLPSTHLIHLHLIPKDPWTIEQAVVHWEMKENFRSITCYIPEAQHPDFINRTSTESDAPSCQINGYIPLVVYPNLDESSGARKTLPLAASVRTNGIPQLDARAPFLDPQVMEEEFGDAETEMERDCYDSFEDHIDYDIKPAQWFESSEDYVDQAMDLEAWATGA
ncbi:hypothetical protein D9611_001491 [Ephemerocybe angulata]|uniref:Uncharacterized protein n=1 Tax=Ephemerocybe angulata TaxID=980116 RepID=A0A8H5CJ84_9AGAR|nr:hypothetical protein D9611_001491 [Tulosesus angulatus]